jgi:DNA modification methylase
MDVINQKLTDDYAIYNGDCVEVIPKLKSNSIHFSVYSPPFNDLYNYSSSDRDLSNNKTYEDFLTHYEFVIKEIFQLTIPGRLTTVHCSDISKGGDRGFIDLPGDIIRLHQKNGFYFTGRRIIWKEPLRMAIRTRAKGLMHKQIVKDSSFCDVASADYILSFRKHGENKIPISHPKGLLNYAGEDQPDLNLIGKYKHWSDPKTNKLSHLIWQRYASSAWYDIRIGNVLPYQKARDSEEEKHVCPLQLDVIERCLTLWTNPGEIVLTPFMGVGSEVYQSVLMFRKAIGIELKQSYFRQAEKNIYMALKNRKNINGKLLG